MRRLAEEERRKREERLKCEGEKRNVEEGEETVQLSKKKQKKLERNPRKEFSKGRENSKLCCGLSCNNPCSLKCSNLMCRKCCKEKAFKEDLDCEGHRVFIRSNREKAKLRSKEVNREDDTDTAENTSENIDSASDAD